MVQDGAVGTKSEPRKNHFAVACLPLAGRLRLSAVVLVVSRALSRTLYLAGSYSQSWLVRATSGHGLTEISDQSLHRGPTSFAADDVPRRHRPQASLWQRPRQGKDSEHPFKSLPCSSPGSPARQRLASTTTPAPNTTTTAGTATSSSSASSSPKKANNVVQRLLFYSVTAAGTFYIGSTFVSYQNQQYRDLFTKHVPLGDFLVEYGEQHHWDEITVQQVVVATVDTAKVVYNFVQRQLGHVTQSAEAKAKDPAPSDKDESKKTSMDDTRARVKSTAAVLKMNVHKAKEELSPEAAAKATALARHKAAQLADEVDELIKKAEDALAKPIESTLEPSPTSKSSSPVPAADVQIVVLSDKPQDANVYVEPLPIGFEPPPGYSRPKPASKPKAEVLPLVAPAVADIAISEPVISHLASTIDDLASYLNANPTAAEKAKGILDNARNDLSNLATRFDKIKEDEKHELEAKLDEQAREYSTKLLELELESQDKLALQREDYEKYVAEEKMKLVQGYRDRLETELKAQTELLNER